MDITKQAKYEPIPELSPYVTTGRYEIPKETFKQALAKVESMADINAPLSLVDIGCANGEFLYYIKKQHSNWKLTGFDPTKSFIEVGKTIEGLSGVRLEVKSLAQAAGENETFDVIVCAGTFQIFPEPEKPLQQLLNLCKNNGVIVCDGLFNKYDIEVKTIFCDHSRIEGEGLWRSDYHQHSQKRLRKFLKGKARSVSFQEVVMIDLPFNPDAPHINEFTFKDAKGKNLITNGLNMIVNPTIMAIRK